MERGQEYLRLIVYLRLHIYGLVHWFVLLLSDQVSTLVLESQSTSRSNEEAQGGVGQDCNPRVEGLRGNESHERKDLSRAEPLANDGPGTASLTDDDLPIVANRLNSTILQCMLDYFEDLSSKLAVDSLRKRPDKKYLHC